MPMRCYGVHVVVDSLDSGFKYRITVYMKFCNQDTYIP